MNEDPKSDPRDYVVDISSLKRPETTPPEAKAEPRRDDQTLSILFKCCNIYAKIRLTADRRAYAGHCPRCARPIRVEIDPNSPNTGKFFAVE